MSEATVMLAAIEQGDPKAAEELLVLVYDELRASAKFKMAQEDPGQTLQPTALVHEAWMRLMAGQSHTFRDRRHFFGAASEAMRRILIDRARRRHALRHGGEHHRVHMEEIDLAAPAEDGQFLAVHEALDKLALEYPVQVELVKLRFIVGMTNEQAAEVLGISPSTGKNYWNFARAWLVNEIKPQ